MKDFSSYHSPKTEVRESSIDRQGLFATEPIKKGEIVVIRSGHIISEQGLKANKDVINDADIQIADNFYLVPLSAEEFSRIMCFVNHSCDPNIGFMGNIICIAMRDIMSGEELTIDYAMYDNNDSKFNCTCKQENCRKVIAGRDWMRKDLQEKYGDYFSSYLLCKIKNDER